MIVIAIIDLDSIAFSIGNGVKLLNPDGTPIREDGKRFLYRDKTEEELIEATDFYMNQILQGGKFTHYIGYMKGDETTTKRKTINPEYKANRSEEPPKWWAFVLNQLFLRWNCKYVNNMETDDACNITRLLLPDSHLVAIDGDLLGLEGTHYNWREGKWYTVTAQEAENKFWSDMICGQVGDNIKGLVGKGKKYWEKLQFDNLGIHPLVYTLEAYVEQLGEFEGINQFAKNYFSLKILDKQEGFVIPEPISVTVKKLESIDHLFNKETQ